ncbi:hypothetical protein BD769DRAFT_1391821 [Suillus cothurnatus]|nr:hypothetical protein BD769DRAFT_1391821 [Suillus cothurnatus]
MATHTFVGYFACKSYRRKSTNGLHNYEDIQFYWAAAEGVIAIFIVVHKPGCTLKACVWDNETLVFKLKRYKASTTTQHGRQLAMEDRASGAVTASQDYCKPNWSKFKERIDMLIDNLHVTVI